MPEDKEVLGFELEFLADTKVLERLKKILGETFENTKNLDKAIQALKDSANGYNLKSLTTQNEQQAKSYEKQKDNLLKLARALDNVKTKQIALNNLNKKFGLKKEGVFDGKSTAQESAKNITGKITQKSSFYKDGDLAFSRDVYSKIAKEGNKTIKTSEVWKDGETLEKTIEKTTYSLEELPEAIKAVVNDLYKIKSQTKPDATGKAVETKTYRQVVDENGKRITRNVTTVDGQVSSYSTSEKAIEEKLGKSKSSHTSKFLSRVKNIVIYRLVRVAMSAITKGVNEGFELLSTNNSAYKDVINSLKASTTALSVTFAQLLLPIAESLSSVLEGLTTKLIDSANAMALQQAMLNGEQKYFKLSKKSIDEYAKSLSNANKSLSQLDKFATLSQGKPLLGTWEDVSSSTEKEIENVKNYSFVLDTIKTTIQNIALVFSGIGWLIIQISKLSETWQKILGGGIYTALIGIGILISKPLAIITTIIAWSNALRKIWESEIPTAFKIATTAAATLAAVLAVAAALIPGGKIKVALALGAGAATAAALANYGIGSLFVPKEDTGASQASYDNPLASGASEYSSNEPVYNEYQSGKKAQVSTSTSDVYLDGNKVGKTLTKTVFSYGAKGGYL
jgi:hypothetical protein